jgi:MerR family mercuric resistance operon transcriptional regulator
MTGHDGASAFTRGDLAQVAGCNGETVRYYEKIGLLPDPPRTAAGYRIYSNAHARRLRFIRRARELGFSIEDIRGLLGLEDGTAPTCSEVKERTERHLSVVRENITGLMRIENVLSETASRCSGTDVPGCPVLGVISLNALPQT